MMPTPFSDGGAFERPPGPPGKYLNLNYLCAESPRMSVAEDPKVCWLDIFRADIYKKASETPHCPRSARHERKHPFPLRAVARPRRQLRVQKSLRATSGHRLSPPTLRVQLTTQTEKNSKWE